MIKLIDHNNNEGLIMSTINDYCLPKCKIIEPNNLSTQYKIEIDSNDDFIDYLFVEYTKGYAEDVSMKVEHNGRDLQDAGDELFFTKLQPIACKGVFPEIDDLLEAIVTNKVTNLLFYPFKTNKWSPCLNMKDNPHVCLTLKGNVSMVKVYVHSLKKDNWNTKYFLNSEEIYRNDIKYLDEQIQNPLNYGVYDYGRPAGTTLSRHNTCLNSINLRIDFKNHSLHKNLLNHLGIEIGGQSVTQVSVQFLELYHKYVNGYKPFHMRTCKSVIIPIDIRKIFGLNGIHLWKLGFHEVRLRTEIKNFDDLEPIRSKCNNNIQGLNKTNISFDIWMLIINKLDIPDFENLKCTCKWLYSIKTDKQTEKFYKERLNNNPIKDITMYNNYSGVVDHLNEQLTISKQNKIINNVYAKNIFQRFKLDQQQNIMWTSIRNIFMKKLYDSPGQFEYAIKQRDTYYELVVDTNDYYDEGQIEWIFIDTDEPILDCDKVVWSHIKNKPNVHLKIEDEFIEKMHTPEEGRFLFISYDNFEGTVSFIFKNKPKEAKVFVSYKSYCCYSNDMFYPHIN